jgi:hypothetical protein
MRKTFLACLTFLVLGVLFTGCGKSNKPQELTPEQQQKIEKAQEYLREKARKKP